MRLEAADVVTLLIAIAVAATAATILLAKARSVVDANRQTWLTAAAIALALIVLGALDVYSRTPREVRLSTIVLAAVIPMISAVGMIRATRRVPLWARWLLVFVTTFLMLFASLLFGATYVSRVTGF